MKLITLFLLSLAAYGQTIVNAPPVTITAKQTSDLAAWMGTQTTDVKTTLSLPISAIDTTIQVAEGAGIGVNSVLFIGSEHLLVTAKVGRNLTVTRGHNGTTAAAAIAGASVLELKYRNLNQLAKVIVVDSFRAISKQVLIAQAAAAAQAAADAEVNAGIQ